VILVQTILRNLRESNDLAPCLASLNFIAATMESQPTLGASLVRKGAGSFLISARSKLREIGNDCPSLLLGVSRLLSEVFRRFSTKSEIVTKIADPEFWENVMDIFRDGRKDCAIVAAKALLIHCILAFGQAVPADTFAMLLNSALQVLPDSFEPLTVPWPRSDPTLPYDRFAGEFADVLNSFVRKTAGREYGDLFYLDLQLVQSFFEKRLERRVIQQFLDGVRRLNRDLSMIDACTQLFNSIRMLSAPPARLEIPWGFAVAVAKAALDNPACPDSFAEVCFDLMDQQLGQSSEPLNKAFFDSLVKYANAKRLTDRSYGQLARLLAASEPALAIDIDAIFVIRQCLEHNSENSFKFARELAYQLRDRGLWICHMPELIQTFQAILCESEAIKHSEIFDCLAAICASPKNAAWLNDQGFFGIFTRLPCEETPDSGLWPHVFRFMTCLPSTLHVALHFIASHFGAIVYFMNSESTPKVQLTITNMFVHVSQYVSAFAFEDPQMLDKMVELVSTNLNQNISLFKSKLHVKFEGSPDDFSTCNDPVCHLFVIRNDLWFLNRLYKFPHGQIRLVVLGTYVSHPICDFLSKVMGVLQLAINKCDDDQFVAVMVQAFELSLRLFTGYLASLGGAIPEATMFLKDPRDVVLQSIQKIRPKVDRFDELSRRFLDVCSDFISTYSRSELRP
jgi:hypothetical protein